ncbi:hypothetical protein, partial [Intestinimonas butyriciproducens]|uniref:hypothetical protein n=1 Tax=Intestinimonas butyriciproducens TaxID=1297617 RepID=UPI00195D9347
CVLGLVGCSQQGQQDIITPTQNNEEISQTDIQSEAEQKYTYEELSEMPAEELLDLFIQNGLVINDDLKAAFTDEELQALFKENFHLWHTGVSAHSHTMYCDLAEQTKAIFDKIAIPNFSYAEDMAIYVEGEPGVKTSGFVNTTETEITFENVAECAKNECTVEYDRITTYFDTDECVWKVHFGTDGMVGGDQSVYLDCDGKTVLIVYGE